MIRYGFIIAFIGVILISLPNYTLSLFGLILVGIGCAPIYPCIIHSTPDNFGKENSQGIIGIQMASAYTGSTFIPPLFGVIASIISLKIMPLWRCEIISVNSNFL